MSRNVLCVFVLALIAAVRVDCVERVPVIMWGATSGSPLVTKALSQLDASDFNDILLEQLDSNPFTVVFIEETLSVEDFSSKDADGRTPYPGLREKMTGESVLYYPAVASALHTLNKIADPGKINRVELTDSGLSADIAPGAGQFLYIRLKDARDGEDRLHMLSRHDQFMTEMFDKLLKKHESVLAIYTGRFPSWEIPPSESRFRRHLLQDTPGNDNMTLAGFYNVSNGTVFIYSPNITIIYNNITTIVNNPKITLNNGTEEMNVTMQFDASTIMFKYHIDDGYWYLALFLTVDDDTVELDTIAFAPLGFSYHCSPELEFTHNNTRIVFLDFQTEPFFGSEGGRFSYPFDCVGFTSVPIWSGLFIVFLVLIITFIGVTMMMNIHTMDRFDDPKGKTITITAAE